MPGRGMIALRRSDAHGYLLCLDGGNREQGKGWRGDMVLDFRHT